MPFDLTPSTVLDGQPCSMLPRVRVRLTGCCYVPIMEIEAGTVPGFISSTACLAGFAGGLLVQPPVTAHVMNRSTREEGMCESICYICETWVEAM